MVLGALRRLAPPADTGDATGSYSQPVPDRRRVFLISGHAKMHSWSRPPSRTTESTSLRDSVVLL